MESQSDVIDPVGTILVVEYDLAALELAMTALAAAGHVVESATDGRDACSRVAAGGIDLVLLDLQLPGIPGLEVLDRLRSSPLNSDIPILTGIGLAVGLATGKPSWAMSAAARWCTARSSGAHSTWPGRACGRPPVGGRAGGGPLRLRPAACAPGAPGWVEGFKHQQPRPNGAPGELSSTE